MKKITDTLNPAAVLIDAVQRWAVTQPGILALALVGSHARGEARPDSDIDFVLLCASPGAWLSERAWLANFGDVAAISMEDWGVLRSLRVDYSDGLQVEFGIAAAKWADLGPAGAGPADPGTAQVVRDGMRILHDPQQLLARLQAAV